MTEEGEASRLFGCAGDISHGSVDQTVSTRAANV